MPLGQSGTIRQRKDSLKEALRAHIKSILGQSRGYEYLPLCSYQREPVNHFLVYIWNLPNSSTGYVFSLIRDDIARKIIAGDDEAEEAVLGLLQMHKTGHAATEEAKRLRDYLFPPLGQ
jgi:hypothetical protein